MANDVNDQVTLPACDLVDRSVVVRDASGEEHVRHYGPSKVVEVDDWIDVPENRVLIRKKL